MPEKFKKYDKAELDGRIKIPRTQYKEVRKLYKDLKSFRAVAKYYNVDKKTIQFIIDPRKIEAYKEYQKKTKPWMKYYDKEKHRLSTKKYREKKRALGYRFYKLKPKNNAKDQ